MASAHPVMPGVPAAGHVAGNGYWHPGRVDNCRKTPCGDDVPCVDCGYMIRLSHGAARNPKIEASHGGRCVRR